MQLRLLSALACRAFCAHRRRCSYSASSSPINVNPPSGEIHDGEGDSRGLWLPRAERGSLTYTSSDRSGIREVGIGAHSRVYEFFMHPLLYWFG